MWNFKENIINNKQELKIFKHNEYNKKYRELADKSTKI